MYYLPRILNGFRMFIFFSQEYFVERHLPVGSAWLEEVRQSVVLLLTSDGPGFARVQSTFYIKF